MSLERQSGITGPRAIFRVRPRYLACDLLAQSGIRGRGPNRPLKTYGDGCHPNGMALHGRTKTYGDGCHPKGMALQRETGRGKIPTRKTGVWGTRHSRSLRATASSHVRDDTSGRDANRAIGPPSPRLRRGRRSQGRRRKKRAEASSAPTRARRRGEPRKNPHTQNRLASERRSKRMGHPALGGEEGCYTLRGMGLVGMGL
jgi:hypothetical protein